MGTHRGSGVVIVKVIFTEATGEFLWAAAKSQQQEEVRGEGKKEGNGYNQHLFTKNKVYLLFLNCTFFFSSSLRSKSDIVSCFNSRCAVFEHNAPHGEEGVAHKANTYSNFVAQSMPLFFSLTRLNLFPFYVLWTFKD